MKKILSLFLALLMIFSVVSLVGCGEKETLKFGMGVYSYSSKVQSATDEAKGLGEGVVTVAAVLLDKNDKIVKCVIDTADNKVNFTADGKAETAEAFKTKYELGDNYGMKAYGGATKEWFEQVDALTALVIGKNVDEVKALLAEDEKGTDDVISAGCTITITDFVKALVKAFANATESEATADDSLKLGIISSQASANDATAEKAGSNGFDTAISATVINADKKVVATAIDTVSFSVSFDTKGVTTDEAKALISKGEQGDNYGMKAYGGAKKEWFEQIDALETLCVGKTADEITALVAADGKGVADVQSAGCTITITDVVKAVAASAK